MFIIRMNIKKLLESDWSADIQNLIEDESEPKDRVPKELSTEKDLLFILLLLLRIELNLTNKVTSCHGKHIFHSSNGSVIKHKHSSYNQRPNMTPKNIYEKSVPGSPTEWQKLISLGISTLEMDLRQELPPLYARDHMAYKSAYFPAKLKTLCIDAVTSGATKQKPVIQQASFPLNFSLCSLTILFMQLHCLREVDGLAPLGESFLSSRGITMSELIIGMVLADTGFN
ncbi:hypothetical protein CQW23_07081 [Capsicum baccatum]|uniref:Uncharacterized protein n=1 Tax=Capsicum baccatum TaxID=33114 RepID=A0A2G2X5C3_CAPBA|nr:hypothetical protein CQW23_07081 [Capsicum baccatum]